jgi:hypothetical protein
MATLSTAQTERAGSKDRRPAPFWLRTARHELGKFRRRNATFYGTFKLPHDLDRELLRFDHAFPADFHGRCPLRKMQAMASLIVRHNLQLSVEIGVYRGSSLLPQALAMTRTGGRVIGIDPWSIDKWRQNQSPSAGKGANWRGGEVEWDPLYREVLELIDRHGVGEHCRIVRGLSHEVADGIPSGIDMLHIDGCHDFDAVERDLHDYLPKLKPGGFLVMDDVTWAGVAPHYKTLKQTMPLIWETVIWGILRKD